MAVKKVIIFVLLVLFNYCILFLYFLILDSASADKEVSSILEPENPSTVFDKSNTL